MSTELWLERGQDLPGAPRWRALQVTAHEWVEAAEHFSSPGGRLVALWADAEAVHAALLGPHGGLALALPLGTGRRYPGLQKLFPAAQRMQRAIRDLHGISATDADVRPWLRHAAWPEGWHPLGTATPPPEGDALGADAYAFVRVEGDGVHEVPVGPVHAGIIEPGHFRFSIVGEKVLRLEERLGYVHKGIERRFTELPLLGAERLAARISGDSAVAYSWAYCQALEGIAGVALPPRALWLRALALELERMANHLGDLGALGNDAGFAFGLTQFSRLKEQLLRAQATALGARYLMDLIVPGGTALDPAPAALAALGRCVAQIAAQVPGLREIYDEHAGVRDRFVGAGEVLPALAAQLGLTGLAGRASAQAFDLRVDQPWAPYDALSVRTVSRAEGDVWARVAVRFDEVLGAAALIEQLLQRLQDAGAHRVAVPLPPAGALGLGLIEGWRGPVLVALRAGAGGGIARCHPHDPSWQNWPVLEHAILGNIVPDFPLINKSFNLSYSGHDL